MPVKFQAASPVPESQRMSRPKGPTVNRPTQSGRAVAVGKDERRSRVSLGNSIEGRRGECRTVGAQFAAHSLIPASRPGLFTNGPSGLKSPRLRVCRYCGRRRGPVWPPASPRYRWLCEPPRKAAPTPKLDFFTAFAGFSFRYGVSLIQ